MKVWIPFRQDNAVLSLNALSGEYHWASKNSCYLHHIKAFHRKKDAVKFMEKMNEGTEYSHDYKIIAFESK